VTDAIFDSAAAPSRAGISPWLVAPTVGLAAFMEVLDISIVNVALQHVAGSLSASADESTWVLTSYLVTNAIVLPISGWLSNRLGRKRYFLGCIVGFGITSLLCGLAPTLLLLIVARGLQGATGGGLQPQRRHPVLPASAGHRPGPGTVLPRPSAEGQEARARGGCRTEHRIRAFKPRRHPKPPLAPSPGR